MEALLMFLDILLVAVHLRLQPYFGSQTRSHHSYLYTDGFTHLLLLGNLVQNVGEERPMALLLKI